ncbi:MAG: 6-carboxytetrahydropterin synthase [Chromatiales bacterium]|jgi:6-pyruvoyl-tetrahydropterin synthase
MTRLFVNKLTVIDFSYLHAERGLLGESWLTDIELQGSLDQQGMVLDFAEVKKQVKRLIDERFDHKLIVPKQYSGCRVKAHNRRTEVIFTTRQGQQIEHIADESAYCLLDAAEVTPDNLADAIIAELRPLLPANVENIVIRLYPEQSDDYFYHYSHGLKQHAGNCQRIAHGHRSRIRILDDGKRDIELEKYWSQLWRDIYIASRDDLAEEQVRDGDNYLHFRYSACQGEFELTLPAQHCYLVDGDSTVENLAQHIADALKRKYPDKQLLVYAYEGVDKGAIAGPA